VTRLDFPGLAFAASPILSSPISTAMGNTQTLARVKW
jgi:hypothetical protein